MTLSTPPAPPTDQRRRLSVAGVPIDAVTPEQARLHIVDWALRRESRVVCACNAHSVVTALHHAAFMHAVASADLATPDGAPVAWMLRRQGVVGQQRVSGPDLMLDVCQQAAERGISVFLYGSTEATLQRLQQRLHARWPALCIAGAHSPPFRALSPDEDRAVVEQINASGAGIVWVSLGCPKQELWMADHHGRVQAVMVGVGAAFDFHAGTVARAPRWMRENGMEWLHRLASEPRRLWKRYLVTNTLFVLAAIRQWVRR